MSERRGNVRAMPLERTFHACPQCGATVAQRLVDFHDRWHAALDEALDAEPQDTGIEVQPWPAAEHEGPGL